MSRAITSPRRNVNKTANTKASKAQPLHVERFFCGQKYIGEPRILFCDIESSPILGHAWQRYDTNLISMIENTKILCVSYRWNHERETKVLALPHFKGYRGGVVDDRHLMEEIWKLLDAADCVVAHNGDKFDVRKINGRFFAHGMTPPRPYLTIDTLKVARKYLYLDSNKMGDICKLLGIGQKLSTHGVDTWLGCMNGEKRAWREMMEYNIHDTVLLYKVFNKLLPWITWKENRRKLIYAKDYE